MDPRFILGHCIIFGLLFQYLIGNVSSEIHYGSPGELENHVPGETWLGVGENIGEESGCVLSLKLSGRQYQELCPVREIANLRKQISHMKRRLRNHTDSWALSQRITSALNRSTQVLAQAETKAKAIQAEFHVMRRTMRSLEEKVHNLTNQLAQKPEPLTSSLIMEIITKLQDNVLTMSEKIHHLEKIPIPSSCDLVRRDGIFTIQPGPSPKPFFVHCDHRWTVIMHRRHGKQNFFQSWLHYKAGFGNLSGEFWLGNDHIHSLTTQAPYRLRVDAHDWNNTYYFAEYKSFYVSGETDLYRLHVRDHSGNLSNALYTEQPSHFNHDGQQFSTFDKDNDGSPSANCAKIFAGGYWYNDCYISNPTGPYCHQGETHSKCMVWWDDDSRLFLKDITWSIRENPRDTLN